MILLGPICLNLTILKTVYDETCILNINSMNDKFLILLSYFARDDHIDYWRNVIFCDEKSFRSDQEGNLHVWRRSGTRYAANNLSIRRKCGHVSLNMFGWMWSHGVGELSQIEGRLDGEFIWAIFSLVASMIKLFLGTNNFCDHLTSSVTPVIMRNFFINQRCNTRACITDLLIILKYVYTPIHPAKGIP